MALLAGARLGPYEIVALLGVGGMGEVYRARDTKLNREVAIKVLPESLAGDPDRLARFSREAHVLAALNHPHIAHIHGFEDSTGVPALVLELVEGPTLADRLENGPIPIDEALHLAKQIAEALESAHDVGIIHRDLKPANIKVRHDGTVKVLDFGLAKALERASGSGLQPSAQDLPNSPTISSPAMMTGVGVILGTAAYMAPEQAKGKPADKRCDVWAFGCVLYEMLTGRQAFGGEAVAEIIGAVIHKEPDWTALPADTPPAIRTLLRRCLKKDRQQRLPDIGIARIEAQDAISGAPSDLSPPAIPARRHREHLAWVIAIVVVALAARLWVRDPPRDTRVYRSSILPVPEAPMSGLPPQRFALSPDGRHLAFIAGGSGTPAELWVRSLERGTVRRLAGTEGSFAHFWSPDGRSVAFFAQGRLKRVDIDGGPPVILADAKGVTSGGSWSKDDVIVFPAVPNGVLFQIHARGGVATPATTLDTDAGDNRHWWPYFLPDGKHFLYEAVGSASSNDDPRAVYIGSLDAAEKSRLLLSGGSNAKYAQGQVLYLRERTLMAQPFDVSRLELTGEPLPIAENIEVGGSTGQSGAFSASETGALVYQTAAADAGSQLAWFDRAGKQTGVFDDRALYGDLELSPDATRAAVSVPRGGRTTIRDIWIVDLLRGVRSPFTLGERAEMAAVWSSDGTRIAFNGGQPGPAGSMNLYMKSSSGAGSEHVLVEDSTIKSPVSWSHNGQFLLYTSRVTESDLNLWVFPVSGGQKPIPYMQTTFNELGARFSPDDRWVAYGSNESGRPEIYIAPFPETGAKWLVSTAGAAIGSARWRSDGRELFYVARDFMLMAAEIDGRGPQIKIGRVTPLFRLPVVPPQGTVYDVAPGGQRFLFNVVGESAGSAPLSLVINWTAVLAKE